MRIGIDIKCLRYNNAGIGRYLRSLLSALQDIDSQNEYFLFTPSESSFKPRNINFEVVVCKSKIKQPGIFWQQNTLPSFIRKKEIDVFWGPEQTLPNIGLGSTAKVLTVHDFVYKRFPETMVKSVLWINKFIGPHSIKNADIICPVSEFTQKELFHFFPKTSKEKVSVVHNGVGPCKPKEAGTQRGENLLFVGSMEPRKNLENLLQALEILHDEGIDVPLTITGPSGWKNASICKRLEKSPVAGNISYTGFVTEDALDKLYDTCAAVVFPSFYEGFGLPVLEALSHRAAVLTSQGSVMEEIAGNFATYFDAHSPASIANSIKTFYQEKEARYKEMEANETRLQELLGHYSWIDAARALLKQFERAVQFKSKARGNA